MSGKVGLKSQVARKYCSRFTETATRQLAAKLYKENKSLFKDEEQARSTVRRIRGKEGKKSRERTLDKSLYQDLKDSTNAWEGFESDIDEPVVFKLPKQFKKIAVLSDIHIPYHDVKAIKAAIKYCKKEQVDCVFINGDLLDFYQMSEYVKDPRKRSLAGELEMGRKFFDILNLEFPGVTKYFIPGNHEHRLEKYLYIKAPELLDIEEFRLDVLLKLGEKKINYIPHGSDVYFSKLLVEHGDKLRGSGGVNPARTAMLKFKRSVLVGHFHRTTSANGNVYRGDNYMAWSTGHLGESNPRYLPVNEWNHGFAIVEIFDDGNFRVNNLQIIDGRVY